MEDKNNFEDDYIFSENNLGAFRWLALGWLSLFAILLGYGIITGIKYIFS